MPLRVCVCVCVLIGTNISKNRLTRIREEGAAREPSCESQPLGLSTERPSARKGRRKRNKIAKEKTQESVVTRFLASNDLLLAHIHTHISLSISLSLPLSFDQTFNRKTYDLSWSETSRRHFNPLRQSSSIPTNCLRHSPRRRAFCMARKTESE